MMTLTLKVHLKMLLTIYEIISRLLTKGLHYYIMKIIKEKLYYELSNDTIAILKNFANINQNILVKLLRN